MSVATMLLLIGLMAGVMGIRNFVVWRYLDGLIDRVSTEARKDIDACRWDWQWRYDILHAAQQGRMVLEFWRPLRSYGLERAAAPRG